LPLRDQAIGTSAKGHGTKIFLQHVFMGLQVFLAEFGKTYIIFIEIRHGTCSFFYKYRTWDKDFLRGKIEMYRSQPLMNFAWSLTTEQPVLRALSSQNVHLLTHPDKKNIQDVI
jgi:hypothetical protein